MKSDVAYNYENFESQYIVSKRKEDSLTQSPNMGTKLKSLAQTDSTSLPPSSPQK